MIPCTDYPEKAVSMVDLIDIYGNGWEKSLFMPHLDCIPARCLMH